MIILDKDICDFLGIEEKKFEKWENIDGKLILAKFSENGKKYCSLIVAAEKPLVEVKRFEGKASYLNGYNIEPIVGNVYCLGTAGSDEICKRQGFKNSFITITAQGIKDGIGKKELPAVFRFLKKYSGYAWTRESEVLKKQVIAEYPKQVIKNMPEGFLNNLNKWEIRECLENVLDDEMALCKGLKLWRKADNLTDFDTRDLLFDIINHGEKVKIETDETNLKGLTGMSLADIEGHHKASVRLALDTYPVRDLSDWGRRVIKQGNEPATALLTEKYRKTYGDELINGVMQHTAVIARLPYKKMFFDNLRGGGYSSQEANFLDVFTDKIAVLAQEKYGEKNSYSRYYSLSNQVENPTFKEDAIGIWNEMFAEADKYMTPKHRNHDNWYVHKMFPEQAKQLREFVGKKYSFEDRLKAEIAYFSKVGKMQRTIKEYCEENRCHLNGNLHFDLVDAGVDNKREAKRCLAIWNAVNKRPDKYASSYNEYDMEEISKIAKSTVLEDWMVPVMLKAMDKGGFDFSEERMPSERTLFDCCKVWTICPEMPQRLAKQVGKHSLYGRMLAGAIFDKMSEEGKTSTEEWRENKHLHVKFYEELSRAEKMKRSEALKQYVPNTVENRKRLTGVGLEEKGLENTRENFAALYQKMSYANMFDKMLAKPEVAKTTFSSRLLVETARLKQAKGR